MAKLNGIFEDGGFDPNSVEDAQGFEPLPTDVDFHFEIGEADLVEPRSGNGTMLKVRCNVLGPSHVGRVIFANLNIQHANADAERIAQQHLRMLCVALGIGKLEDTDELLGGQFLGRCRTRPAKDGYAAQSEIDFATLRPMSAAAPVRAAAPVSAAAPVRAAAKSAAPAAKSTPPWAKGTRAA